MNNALKEFTSRVLDMFSTYSTNRDLAVYFPEFLSLYLLSCISKVDIIDENMQV